MEKHLSLLKRERLIANWNDRDIKAGEEWKKKIDENLQAADIILLLISANFMSSDYCYSIEMKFAMKKHKLGEARVIPIILRPVDWHKAEFGKLQALPKDSKPVTTWPNEDEALYSVAIGLREVIGEMKKKVF